jgi:hypothetical protein
MCAACSLTNLPQEHNEWFAVKHVLWNSPTSFLPKELLSGQIYRATPLYYLLVLVLLVVRFGSLPITSLHVATVRSSKSLLPMSIFSWKWPNHWNVGWWGRRSWPARGRRSLWRRSPWPAHGRTQSMVSWWHISCINTCLIQPRPTSWEPAQRLPLLASPWPAAQEQGPSDSSQASGTVPPSRYWHHR